MIYATEAKLASRAKTLGESASAEGFAELHAYCASESPLVRRIAASALGKLSGVVKGKEAVATLMPLLADEHPQVRQYAAKALSAFGQTRKRPCRSCAISTAIWLKKIMSSEA
jgi:HEAT repeat protein